MPLVIYGRTLVYYGVKMKRNILGQNKCTTEDWCLRETRMLLDRKLSLLSARVFEEA